MFCTFVLNMCKPGFSDDIAPFIETLPRYIKGPLLRNAQRDTENSILSQSLWEDLEKLKKYF